MENEEKKEPRVKALLYGQIEGDKVQRFNGDFFKNEVDGLYDVVCRPFVKYSEALGCKVNSRVVQINGQKVFCIFFMDGSVWEVEKGWRKDDGLGTMTQWIWQTYQSLSRVTKFDEPEEKKLATNLKGKIFGIDFDGTCVMHEFPKIGADVPRCVEVLKEIIAAGGKLILWTMRCNHTELPKSDDKDIHCEAGQYLDDAVNWFKERDIPLFGIQCNPGQHTWSKSPKAYAHIYIDDAALGCPLIKIGNDRPYVDWVVVEALLFPEKF